LKESVSDDIFLEAFERLELYPEVLDHRAHFRIAWLYLQRFDFEEALKKIKFGIIHFDKKFGDGKKFHETITVAYTHILHFRMQTSHAGSWKEFLGENPDLLLPVNECLGKYYSLDTLSSEEAKARFIAPDLKNFNTKIFIQEK
jgi:hypothetical protein